MPFKSEKQKRYLWANEPEIARDWTDTYGNRIKKNDGGIMNVPRRRYFSGAYGQGAGDRGGNPHASAAQNIASGHVTGNEAQQVKERYNITKKDIKTAKKETKDRNKITNIKPRGTITQKALYGLLKNNPKHALQYLSTVKDEDEELWGNLPQNLKDLIEVDPSGMEINAFSDYKDYPDLKFDDWSSLTQVPGYGNYLKERGMPGVKHSGNVGGLGDRYVKYTGELDAQGKKIKETDRYGNTLYGYGPAGGDGQGGGYMGYPNYAAWQTAQGGGRSGGITTATAASTPSAFQQSLTTTADTPDYYVGDNPLASNLAWGKTYGVDPRTMGRTSWAADGGRIGRAYGGIMDSSTGRRAYGFGSIFKSIGKAAKKVLGSKVGKLALGAGAMAGAHKLGWLGKEGWLAPMLRKKLADTATTGIWGAPSWAKIGIGAVGALPFFMGGEEEDEGSKFDYEGAKNKYWDELMRIKSGAMAGSLDPTKFNYLGAKDGGRIGLYAGGQSTPSDYTMEDAMMTTTQDKLGGITDVMKQADLSRQGSVGQFYAAEGGSPNNDRLMERVKELEDEGLDFGAAMAQAMKELSQGKAHGGRIGADEGGLMDLGGMEKDYRNDGGFVPLGGEEKADDVPARLSKNEFVFTADAVRGAGEGDIDKGAEIMENIMKNLEQGGQISEETQGLSGAQEMFGVSERLGEVL